MEKNKREEIPKWNRFWNRVRNHIGARKLSPENNHGFSLVELIIVIAIMAILAAAIAPALIRYINKARKADDIAGADAIGHTFQTALIDDEDIYDWFTWCSADIAGSLTRLPRRQWRIVAFCAAPGAYKEQQLQLVTAYVSTEMSNKKVAFTEKISNYLGSCYAPLKFKKTTELDCWFICVNSTNEISIWVGAGANPTQNAWIVTDGTDYAVQGRKSRVYQLWPNTDPAYMELNTPSDVTWISISG